MKLVGAVKAYFGLKPGQTLSEFSAEYKQLTAADKAELAALLRDQGFDPEDYPVEAT